MNDTVIERAKQNRCPICNIGLPVEQESNEIEVVDYNGQVVFVHKKHIKYGNTRE